ncbi:MAG: sialate O-acetylesterase [Verrucomicrobiota bacterium]
MRAFLPFSLFSLFLLSASRATECAAADTPKPLQVYILAGQSNMQGHAQLRTFERLRLDSESKPLLDLMTDAAGKPRVAERTWISSLGTADTEQTGKLTAGFGSAQGGPKIGPEFTFGLAMETVTDAPILIIKTSWGGRSLHTDFRPPSAGPYPFPDGQLEELARKGKDTAALKAEKAAQTGTSYRLMIDHVRSVLANLSRVVPGHDAAAKHELAGFVWYQGCNDMVDSGTYPRRDQPGGYDAYSETLAHFIRDVRRDLAAPELPFVIGVLGVGGPTEAYGKDQLRYKPTHDNFRKAMAAPASLPEFKGTVAAVRTEQFWDMDLSAAKTRESSLRAQIKERIRDGKLPAADENREFTALRSSELSERERALLDTGISNAEFHYLGSARILGGIGKGFADAMAQLQGLAPGKP